MYCNNTHLCADKEILQTRNYAQIKCESRFAFKTLFPKNLCSHICTAFSEPVENRDSAENEAELLTKPFGVSESEPLSERTRMQQGSSVGGDLYTRLIWMGVQTRTQSLPLLQGVSWLKQRPLCDEKNYTRTAGNKCHTGYEITQTNCTQHICTIQRYYHKVMCMKKHYFLWNINAETIRYSMQDFLKNKTFITQTQLTPLNHHLWPDRSVWLSVSAEVNHVWNLFIYV